MCAIFFPKAAVGWGEARTPTKFMIYYITLPKTRLYVKLKVSSPQMRVSCFFFRQFQAVF